MKQLALILSYLVSFLATAQTAEYWVYFKGKPHAEQAIAEGRLAIGEEALEKRFLRGVPIDAKDVAVFPEFTQELRNMGAEVIGTSRWLNAAVVGWTGNSLDLERLECVRKVEAVGCWGAGPAAYSHSMGSTRLDYGSAAQQIQLLNGQSLHEDGFTGAGVRIAVLDAGFANAYAMTTFDSMFVDQRLVDSYDFVHGDTNVYDAGGGHGTAVLSCMAALNPDTLIGTAPHAEYALYTTENVFSETRQEEYNWIFGAERADSTGCDIINSSLGYYEMDDPSQSYSFSQMDGGSTVVTRGADAAASRGLLVVSSAGNEGFSSWQRIIAPCDGDSVFCIGGVTMTGAFALFSSRGPSADGRVKPNVSAVAASVQVANGSDVPVPANGTSFSSPTIAGLMACAWQKYPTKTNWELMRAVEFISNRYWAPDSLTGYGFPDFSRIDELLSAEGAISERRSLEVFPNPSDGDIRFALDGNEGSASWHLMDLFGRIVQSGTSENGRLRLSPELPAGAYILKVAAGELIGIQRIEIR